MSHASGQPPPVISVLMVAYNAGTFLAPAVGSILAQTCTPLELVLVDNASTDGSVDALLRDPRLKLCRLSENFGPVGGWRAGFPGCQGEWLAFLDADDIAQPGRLEAQRDFFAAHPGVDLVTTLAEKIDAAGRPLGLAFSVLDELDIRAFAEFDMPVLLTTAMMRRAFAEHIGFKPDSSWAGDYEFLLRALEIGRVACLPEVLNAYRVHAGSMTNAGHNRQALSAARARFRAVRRARGQADNGDEDGEREALKHPLGLRALHRFCLQRALAERLPGLAIFHARRARSPLGVLRGLAAAARWDRSRLGLLCRLALFGPLRALKVRTTLDPVADRRRHGIGSAGKITVAKDLP